MWQLINNKLLKQVGEIVYVVEFKPAIEAELDGTWLAFRQESGLIQIGLGESSRLEACIKCCNKDAKHE